MFRVINITFLLLGLLSGICLYAQNELGNPYIKNYSPKSYNSSATVWDITQDKNGLMYFGVADGVMQYDGTNWQTIPIDNHTTVRALDINDKGIVYVGAKNEFGYLAKDSLGKTTYYSLIDQIEEKYKEFADVWNVYSTKEGVFFMSFKRVYQWQNNKITVHEFDDISAHLGFYTNENLYLVRIKAGLHVFKDGQFRPVPGGNHYTKKPIFAILPFNNDNIIVATRNEGLELHNIKTGEVLPFENDVNDELKAAKIYHATISEKGGYVIATLKRGVYVIDREGHLVMNINESNGLINDNVKYVFKDKYGGVWAGTAVGISYIDLNLPLTFFSHENGIKGYCRDLIRHNDVLYVATGNGLYFLDKNELDSEQKFKRVNGADEQFWTFIEINSHLLVGSSAGLFEVKEGAIERIQSFNGNAVFSLLRSKIDDNRIYIALKNGVAIAEIMSNDEIKVVHQFENYVDESHHLGEDKTGNLWVSTAFDYLVKIDHTSFNKENGYPLKMKKIEYGEKLSSEGIIEHNGEVLFTSSSGFLSPGIDDKLQANNSIVVENLPKDYVLRIVKKDKQGNLWIHYHLGKTSGQFMARKTKKGTYQIKEDPFTRVNEKLSHTSAPLIDNDGVVWFIGGEGLIRYDYNKDIVNRKNYNVNIRRVTLHSDSIIAYSTNNELNLENFTFSFRNNATSFRFSAASYGNEKENKYQYFLEGYDKEWSDWVSAGSKEYNYLPENTYVFRVRAKNIYNQISKEDQFTFVILPPWYRETWAYIVYGLLFLILIYLIIKIATYRLQKSKRQLELIVDERTKDIVKEKEKVEEQKLLIEEVHSKLSERNKDVMDSIKYAKRIQSSILPPLDKLKNEFNESFVLYKPRDIVSGDFYWYEKVGDYFIMACADCTGHGVPGAFMSMIGATLLNKIVEQENIGHCKDALNELDKEIVKTLQQTSISDNNMSMDGMDIALIAVNQKLMECHYSGAYRPLYIIRDNELIIYKANRQSIGGGINKNVSFTGDVIELKSGDLIYMFTDGVTDQFGGEKNKKYKTERLKKLLLKISDQNLEMQSKLINEEFETWKGDNEQIDDVLITGIKIP